MSLTELIDRPPAAARSIDTSPATMPRRRVLISALAVSPVRGSECAVGWQLPVRLARYHDVTLICNPGTHDPHKAEIEQELRNRPIAGLTVHCIEPPPLYHFFDRESHSRVSFLRGGFYIGYAAWQRSAFAAVMRMHREQPFDLVHQLNIVTYREPSYLYRMTRLGVPFVWGPVAGASDFPWQYLGLLRPYSRLAYGLRNIANGLQKRLAIRPRRAARAASQIWTVGRDNYNLVTRRYGAKAENLFEVGTVPQPLASVRSYTPGEPLRLAWAGYYVGRKALPILLRAMAKLRPQVRVELTLMGWGPERGAWGALAEQLRIGDQVTWVEKLPQAQALARMAAAHAFAFPSLQEASSTVVLEALSLGLPIVCHDVCGMGMVVNVDCGIRVPVSTIDGSVEGFAQGLRRLAQEEGLVQRLSAGALARSAELSWDENAGRIARTYDRILSVKHQNEGKPG